MIRPTSNRLRSGHTLLEMMLSLVLLSIVMASVGSAVLFASHVMPGKDSPASTLIHDSSVLRQIAEDLALAQHVIERETNSITVVVADRTGDGLPERIRYAWSGVAGDPLTYQLNDASAFTILESVESFGLTYDLDTVATALPGSLGEGSEILLASMDTLGTTYGYSLSSSKGIGQRVTPTLSAGATGFRATRIEYYASSSGSATGGFPVLIRGLSGSTPTDPTYAAGAVLESSLSSSYNWESVSLVSAETIPAGTQTVLLFGPGIGSGNVGRVAYDDWTAPSYSYTSNGGSSWSFAGAGSVYYRLYGREISASKNWDVDRSHVTDVTITLQSTAADNSPITRMVRLEQAPEVLTQFWEAGFDADPALQDLDGDGSADWAYQNGSFSDSEINAGVWASSDELVIQPAGQFSSVITVNARLRASNGKQAEIRGPFHDDADGMLTLVTVLQDDGSGNQELLLYNEDDPANTDTPFATITGLGSDWIDLKMLIIPDEGLLSVWINGEPMGVATLTRFAVSDQDEVLWIKGDKDGGAFADLRISVGGSYTTTTDTPDFNTVLQGTISY